MTQDITKAAIVNGPSQDGMAKTLRANKKTRKGIVNFGLRWQLPDEFAREIEQRPTKRYARIDTMSRNNESYLKIEGAIVDTTFTVDLHKFVAWYNPSDRTGSMELLS